MSFASSDFPQEFWVWDLKDSITSFITLFNGTVYFISCWSDLVPTLSWLFLALQFQPQELIFSSASPFSHTDQTVEFHNESQIRPMMTTIVNVLLQVH